MSLPRPDRLPPDEYDRGQSDAFLCATCGGNAWRVFTGERRTDGTVAVRLRCARGCDRLVKTSWLAAPPR